MRFTLNKTKLKKNCVVVFYERPSKNKFDVIIMLRSKQIVRPQSPHWNDRQRKGLGNKTVQTALKLIKLSLNKQLIAFDERPLFRKADKYKVALDWQTVDNEVIVFQVCIQHIAFYC